MRPIALIIAFAAALAALAGCKSMYGDPPDPMPKIHARPAPPVAVEPVHYIDDCATDFHRDTRGVHAKRDAADTLVSSGDAAATSAAKASGAAQTDLLVRTIQHYADALRADPYSARATLGLAVAYDRVLRKGCALAMLRRLEDLAQNPVVAPDAGHKIDDVVDNTQWFKGYRKDALAAVNH
jgi:hypothetical protein